MTRPRVRIAGVAAAFLLAATISVVPVTAAAKCYPGRPPDFPHYRWAGWAVNLNGLGGNQAYILNYSPWVDPSVYGGNDFASTWAMLDTTDGSHYAQIGWAEYPYDYRYTWDQWTAGGGTYNTFGTAYPVGSQIYYTILYLNGGYTFQFYANGRIFDQQNESDWVPGRAEEQNETHTASTQVAGGYNAPQAIDYGSLWVGVPGTGQGGWQDFNLNSRATVWQGGLPWTANGDPWVYAQEVWDPNHHINTWDGACAT